MEDLKIFPWQDGGKPYWVNPENGLEWYVDMDTTKWCYRKNVGDTPVLEAVCFYVCSNKGGKITPLSRVLIDKKTNQVLAEETSLEAISCKIDMIRFCLKYN